AAGTGRGLDAHEGELDLLARGLDLGAAPGDMDRRTADVEAVGAAGALVVDDFVGLGRLVVADQHAGAVGDDHRGLGDLGLLAQRLEQHRKLVRVEDVDALLLHAERFAQLGEVDARRLFTVDVAAGAGVVLAAGHAHRAV